ncbi:MAG: DegV family protein [Candidatus Heimdallarchaeota archaeon]|nr:DegV family protein [Candidatus Heimdallarchaeota archaeon]
MARIALVTDSTCDPKPHQAKELDIKVVETPIFIDDETILLYRDQLTDQEFVDKINNAKKFPTTSQPSPGQFLEVFEKLRDEGYSQILVVTLSKKLSGTFNSAFQAADMVENVEVAIADSSLVSAPLFSCVLYARKLIDADVELNECVRRIEEYGNSLTGYFSVATLENLVRGGRMSPLRYRLGKFLNYKPILQVHDGVISAFGKTRSIEKTRELAYYESTKQFDKDDEVDYIISHFNAEGLAKEFEQRVQQEFPKANGFIQSIGSIAIHTGEECLLVFMYKLPSI